MRPELYKLIWEVVTDFCAFICCEFKVFSSKAEANEYARRRERVLNNFELIEKKAQDGYYFKYQDSFKVREIDGFSISIT